MNSSKKDEVIEKMFEKGILLNKDMVDKGVDVTLFEKVKAEEDLVVLNNDYAEVISQQSSLVDWYEVDEHRVNAEKERDDQLYQSHLQDLRKSTIVLDGKSQSVSNLEIELTEKIEFTTEGEYDEALVDTSNNGLQEREGEVIRAPIEITLSFINKPRPYKVKDFTNFFLSRYRYLEGLLRTRRELENIMAINRAAQKKEKGTVSIIGLVVDIAETKNANIIITLEDITGEMKILFSKKNKELLLAAKDLVVDEVIGVSGMTGDNIIFADRIVWPDIPLDHELKKSDTEEYAIFLSDIHVGSSLFLRKEFEKFLHWINGKGGNEAQKEIAKKVKYIFIAGDLVDGVGIYPSQIDELDITDIKEQYAEFSRLAGQIPLDKQVIICPGNHDVVHLAEPQAVFYQEFAPDLFSLPNATLVTNPSIITIGKTEDFSGFDVLMYHGYSFDYYVANVESIRMSGGYRRSDLIMKFLLKRRHLAPSFRSTPYYPSHDEDPLLIRTVPDFLITGHIHYCCVANYRGITMISGSCWQGKTTFQEKLGHEPEPARVPLVNLKTREVKILRFG